MSIYWYENCLVYSYEVSGMYIHGVVEFGR